MIYFVRMKKTLFILLCNTLLIACFEKKPEVMLTNSASADSLAPSQQWTLKQLAERASDHLDSALWDVQLFDQDKTTYTAYQEYFSEYPLHVSAFPVADYDYAVASYPFMIKEGHAFLKGVNIGEIADTLTDEVIDAMTLIVMTTDSLAEENTFVQSRNFPYLTAQGYFKTNQNQFDWTFTKNPKEAGILLINMKHFDLRFGETIVILTQPDNSFQYLQLQLSANSYEHHKEFERALLSDPKIKTALKKLNSIH